MAGVKGRSGGRRPGAGRKSEATRTYQESMRAVFEQIITRDDWQKVVMTALALAKAGDKSAREWLSDWVIGKVPDELKAEVKAKVLLEYVNDWRNSED